MMLAAAAVAPYPGLAIPWRRLGMLTAICAYMLLQGCATGRARSIEMRPQAAMPAAQEPAAAATVDSTTSSLERLSKAVEELGVNGVSRTAIVRALWELANALELLPAGDAKAAEKLRDAARRIETSSSPSDQITAMQEALTSTVHSLFARSAPPGRALDYRSSVQAFNTALGDLVVEKPFSEQQPTISAMFRAAADAVHLARGGEPPFGEAEAREAQASGAGDAQESLEQAQADVLRLGLLKWMHAREAAARALSSMADVIEAADVGRKQRERLSKIRFQVERLRTAAVLSFGHAEWIRSGLEAVLDALDSIHAADELKIAPWTRAARQAVANIDGGESLAFQRAAVQDGFRATADALLAAAWSDQQCR